jgi:hypothetical protein
VSTPPVTTQIRMREERHLTLDDEREEKLLQPSAFVCAQQIELNSHLMLADGSHHSSCAEKRVGAVGHVEGETNARTRRNGAGRLDHHAVEAEVDRFAVQLSLIRAEVNFGANRDAAKAALFLFDGALRDPNQPLQARHVDGLVEEEAGASVESLGNRGGALIVADHDDGRSLVESGTTRLLGELNSARSGHRKIKQHDIKFLIAQISGGVCALRQGQRIQAGRTQDTLNQLAHGRFVVNDQGSSGHTFFDLRERHPIWYTGITGAGYVRIGDS